MLGDDGAVAFVIQNAIDVTALYDVDETGQAPSLHTGPIGESQGVLQAQTHQAMTRILNAERGHLLGLFNQAPGFIAVLRGPLHVFEVVNEAYYQLLGHREIVGKPLREAIPDVMGQGFEELLDNVYSTGKPFVGKGIRFEAKRTVGGPFVELFIDLLYQPFFDADGMVSGMGGAKHITGSNALRGLGYPSLPGAGAGREVDAMRPPGCRRWCLPMAREVLGRPQFFST